MYRNVAARVSLFVSVGVCFLLAGAPAIAGEAPGAKTPIVGFATRQGRSAPLRDFRPAGPLELKPNREVHNEAMPKKGSGVAARAVSDPAAQKHFGLSQPEPSIQFEGASDDDNGAVTGRLIVPPDTEGDVGPNHYVQYINNVAVIYDKTGNIVQGPFAGNAFWAGLGGPCEIQNDGDPLVRYDRQADRWVFSQFALPNYPDGPFYQCIAVSTTGDPTGDYYQYEFKTSDDFFSDYGKLGVWPDAYYMTFNMFGPDNAFRGGAYAFDRGAMLSGAPAGMIIFDTDQEGGVLPSDLDGPTPPPAGAPNYFMTFETGPARLLQWQFHVDWTTPANSTFTGPVEIPAAEFIYPVCDAPRGQCVPQLNSPEKLETLQERVMYRLAYRNFGDHESLLVNQTVGTELGSSGVRWYEVRNPGAGAVIYQQGTYAPDDSFRWMGSLAMDGNGNIALGYSKSSSAMHPAIAVTGRLAGDPLGTMGAEDVWFAGAGSQIDSSSRWGDYSTMSIDPSDDCTFWYTQQYYAETSGFNFRTRVGAFRFPSCTSGASGALSGTVTDGSAPLAGATVTATPGATGPAGAGDSTTTTDAAGHYQFLTLPVGTYTVTASKFGYAPSTASGVAITGGGSAVQDFALVQSATVSVIGTVKDGSGQGWPLYAKIVVSGPSGFPGATLFTDPVTGYYSIPLVGGASYDFRVSAITAGYAVGGGPLSLPAAPSANPAGSVVANWSLHAVAPCNAPGYGPGAFTGPPVLSEGFDAGTLPPGWSVNTASGVSWQVASGADPCGQFDGNRTGGSGPYAILNSACFSVGTDDSSLVTAPMDLSGKTTVAIQWANDFVDFDSGTVAGVDLSIDGGATWENVWIAPRPDLQGPGDPLADMTFAAGHPDVRARFHYNGFWAWWWQVDDVEVGAFACTPLPGGLVVGNVTDANTGLGLTGATVQNTAGGDPTTTFATPQDPSQGDGFYILFSESSAQSFAAAFPQHNPSTKTTIVIPNGTSRLDFALAAGVLSAGPRPLSVSMTPGGSQNLTLNLTNSGTGTAGFVIQELNVPPLSVPTNRPAVFASARDRKAALKRIPFNRMNDASTKGLPPPPGAPAGAPILAQAGNVVASFPSGLADGWGLVYDSGTGRLWISNPDAPDFGHPGDGFEYSYLPDGTQTGDTIDIHQTGGIWQGAGAYNARTGMLWEVNVGGDMCLFEMDPVAKVVTGRKICGPWSSSQRVVAYDYATDTYYVGGTNDSTVYHIDASGTLLDSAAVGIGIAGLAYNPSTRHLFVASEAPNPLNVWVLDPGNAYKILGGFTVTSGGVPVLQNGNASLAPACDGRLWAIDPSTQIVYEFESGETGWCVDDIPWLSEAPNAGTVPSGGSLPVSVAFDSAGLLPGLRLGSLLFATDTPDPVAPVPVDFTVLFGDVPEGSFAWNYIYGAAGSGVMPGCAPQAPTFLFCPADVVTRRTMAGFIERAVHGALVPPPVYLGEFGDVLAGSFNANYIQGLVDDGITAGCGGGNYCPDVPVTRAQMAVFVWKGQHGAEAPPECTPPGTFADVACPGGFAVDYIEGIAAEGITAGCGSGNYCPNASITNAQMAVFLVKAFQIPYLP